MVGDVEGKIAVILDDMISTGGTLVAAAELLMKRGASDVQAAATHGVFADSALERLATSHISKVIVTDSVPLPSAGPRDMVEIVTIAPFLADAIMRIHKDLSISALFT